MTKFTSNRQSLIIGVLIGVAITIISFFIYLNLLSLSIILSGFFSAITGLGIAVIISIAIFFRDSFLKVYHYVKQSKIEISIENAEFIAKGFDHSCVGYQLKVSIINKGRIICPFLNDLSIDIKDSEGNSPNLIKLTKLIGDKKDITLEKEKMRKVSTCLFDKEDNKYDMKGLKLDDPYFMFYPCENSTANVIGKKMKSAFNYSEYLLDLDDKKYSVNIMLKYIVENEVIPLKKTFSKKPPFATYFTTSKDTELSALLLQTDHLKNKLAECENNLINKENESKRQYEIIRNKESEISKISENSLHIKENEIMKLNENIKDKQSEITKKTIDMQRLVVEKENLSKQISQKDQQIERYNEQMREYDKLIENCRKENEELKNPSRKKFVP